MNWGVVFSQGMRLKQYQCSMETNEGEGCQQICCSWCTSALINPVLAPFGVERYQGKAPSTGGRFDVLVSIRCSYETYRRLPLKPR